MLTKQKTLSLSTKPNFNSNIKLYLVRHGETEFNKQNRCQGQEIDSELNCDGIIQAKQTGLYFKNQNIIFNKCYASTLVRTHQTLNEINLDNKPVNKDARLNERAMGKLSGKTMDEFFSIKNSYKKGNDFEKEYGIESNESVFKRFKSFLQSLVESARATSVTPILIVDKNDAPNILIVTHGRMISTILKEFFDIKTKVRNGSITNIDMYYDSTNNAPKPKAYKLVLSENGITLHTHLTPRIVYNKIIYPDNHYVFKSKTNKTCVCSLRYTNNDNIYEYLVELNPTDSRGYRTIVGLNAFFRQTQLNRQYSAEEKQGMLIISNIVMCAFEEFGLIPQLEVAGNNSQYSENFTSYCGTIEEPSILHSHIICRGDPARAYISNIKLGGPKLGQLFNMRVGKEKWQNESEIQEIATALRDSIKNVLNNEGIFKNISIV